MAERWEKFLERWAGAGLIDAAAVERICAWQAEQEQSGGLRWPVLLAVAFGGILLAAGVLLFVAAHWDDLSPASRFSLVLLMVAVFHVGGAATAERFRPLSITSHAVGTVTLGAAIFLSGQIFNLQEHWPGGIMLWAIGAWLGWLLLRDWTQATLAAILTPAWLASEWAFYTEQYSGEHLIIQQGLLLLSITYLTARTAERDSHIRRALLWVGGLTIIPHAACAAEPWWGSVYPAPPLSMLMLGYAVAFVLPLGLAYYLRGRSAWMNTVAALWVAVLATMTTVTYERVGDSLFMFFWRGYGRYLWLWLGCIGLIAWGLRETRRAYVNLGVAGFAVTTLAFYFSSVMDKLGRSVSLIGLGVLFLVGGWFLEKARRSLIARVKAGAQ